MSGGEVTWSINTNGILSTYCLKPKCISFKNNFQLKTLLQLENSFTSEQNISYWMTRKKPVAFWGSWWELLFQWAALPGMLVWMLQHTQPLHSVPKFCTPNYPQCNIIKKKKNLHWLVFTSTVLLLQLLLQLYWVHLALCPDPDCSQ